MGSLGVHGRGQEQTGVIFDFHLAEARIGEHALHFQFRWQRIVLDHTAFPVVNIGQLFRRYKMDDIKRRARFEYSAGFLNGQVLVSEMRESGK